MPFKNKAEGREYQKIWARNQRKWFWEFKKKLKCLKCGFSHPAALQFHHRENKKYEIGKMIGVRFKHETLMKEIAKCDVLCANCHAIEHYNQGYRGSGAKGKIKIPKQRTLLDNLK